MTDPSTLSRQFGMPADAVRPIDPFLIVPAHFLPPVLQSVKQPFATLIGVARAIADDTAGAPAERIALLDGMAALVVGQKPVIAMDIVLSRVAEDFARAAIGCGGDPLHAVHILQACRQDVTKQRYRDWNELLVYCRFAAAPIARFCLDVVEEKTVQAPAEALCCALAVLIKLRDCGGDYRRLDRVYLPERWFKEAGIAVSALGAARSDDGMRRVIAQGLDAVERLLLTARPLPRLIDNRHARAAVTAALFMAEKMARRLHHGDPLAGAVMPSLGDGQVALWLGRWRKFRR